MSEMLTLAPAGAPAPVVTRDQLALIKKTVAVGATDAELELFLFDCQRRGVHPLDRLIHFTKRGGRYTPITSIDFLRGRAHDTGEMAGSDDVVFDKDARTATVTVYRLTRGTRYAYSATARYNEYVPAPGQAPHVETDAARDAREMCRGARVAESVPATARRAVREGRTRAGAAGLHDRGDEYRGPSTRCRPCRRCRRWPTRQRRA